MLAYADTSFLVSLYGRDSNSAPAQKIASEFKTPLAFTPLLRFEARNAIRLARFRKDITEADCQAVVSAIEEDVRTGALLETPVSWAEVFAEAEALSAAHTPQLGIHALDTLHVASAAALGVKNFYTFDARQKALAKKAGMNAKP